MKLSIRYKFLLVATSLLVFCVGLYLLLATRIFKTDKTQVVFDYNRSLVTNLSSDLDSLFRSVRDRMKLAVVVGRGQRNEVIRNLLSEDGEIVFLGSDEPLHISQEFLKTYNLPPSYFERELQEKVANPVAEIIKEGEFIWNASVDVPLIGYGKSVLEEDERGIPKRQFVVIAFMKVDKILSSLKSGEFNTAFVVNSRGQILVHPDAEVMMGRSPMEGALVRTARSHPLRTSVLEIADGGQKLLGAFSKAFGGALIVISQVSEERAFSVVSQLVYRSGLFALIVVTLAFIVAILFSRSLTRPIEELVKGMRQVASGDLKTQIKVQTQDEIELLAKSFNSMIRDLEASRHQLEEINRDLEVKVQERTHELEEQNRAVKKAQEALIRTSKLAAIGEVAGQAAHEVLNPLTSIMTRVQNVKDRLESDLKEESELLVQIQTGWQKDMESGGVRQLMKSWGEPSEVNPGMTLGQEDLGNLREISERYRNEVQQLREDTGFLIREGQRINKILNSMRSLTVVNADLKESSLHELLRESNNVMADLAHQRKTEVTLELRAEKDLVVLDQDEFLQCTTNLLRNSLHAIEDRRKMEPELKGRIRIETEEVASKIQIRIQDNGIGIKPENVNRLFENSFSTRSREEGTGIGLKVARKLIRVFNGDIRLEKSEPMKGTSFIIELPLLAAAKKASA